MEIGDKIGRVDNTELEAALKNLKEDNSRENFNAFIGILPTAKFFIPAVIEQIPENNADSDTETKRVKINFRVVTDPKENHFFPCFTSTDELDEGIKDDKENVEKVALTFDDLSDLIEKSDGKINGFVINPNSNGIQISTKMIEAILKAKKNASANVKKQPIPANIKIRLRTPKYMPIDMLEKAKEYFKKHQNVNAAYIQMMEKPDEDEEYLIAVDFEGDGEALFDGLMPEIKELSFGIPIELTGVDNGLGQKVAENTEPFYKKNEQ